MVVGKFGLDYQLTNSWVELDYSAFIHNLKQIRCAIGQRKLVAVIKSNAYGHGLSQIAQACQKRGEVDWVATAGEEEALLVRKSGCKKPILILSYYTDYNILRHLTNCRLVIYNQQQVRELKKYKISHPVHLKIDTGTSRVGLKLAQIKKFCNWLKKFYPQLHIEGVWSHFATAEEENWSFTSQQQHCLQQAVAMVKSVGYRPQYVHIDCSAPALRQSTTFTNMVRVGLSLYGLWPSESTRLHSTNFSLKPVLTWRTTIIDLKELPKGTGIGYGQTYVLPRRAIIAILPVGYYEGYRRSLAGGEVLIRGQRCPIRGRICMNLMMVDVTHLSKVSIGDKVVLLGKLGKYQITAEDLALRAKTINYEVVTNINPLLNRHWI